MISQYVPLPSRVLSRSHTLCNRFASIHQRHHRTRMVALRQNGTSNDPEKQVVLLSGGVESSTLLHRVKKHHEEVVGLFFRYGQRAVVQEEMAARAQCTNTGVKDFVVADLTNIGETFRSHQKERLHVPLLHRNLVLLSLGVSLAAQEGGRVWIAVCKDDLSWYASASAEFLKNFKSCARTLEVEVETPLIDLGKAEVVNLGIELGVKFNTTWSCMIGRGRACGRCVQCRARRKAFVECGLDEFT